MTFSSSDLPALTAKSRKPRRARRPGTSGKGLESAVANGGGIIEWTRIPNGAKYLPGGKAIPVKSPVDCVGTVIGKGRAIFTDAKQCGGDTAFDANKSALKPHQVDMLIQHGRAGAIAGLLIESTAHRQYHWLDWRRLVVWKPTYRWDCLPIVGPATHAVKWERVISTADSTEAPDRKPPFQEAKEQVHRQFPQAMRKLVEAERLEREMPAAPKGAPHA